MTSNGPIGPISSNMQAIPYDVRVPFSSREAEEMRDTLDKFKKLIKGRPKPVKSSKKEYNMSWANIYIRQLTEHQLSAVTFRPRDKSMEPLIMDKAMVTVNPVESETLKVGDIVLCKVKGVQYLHKITAIDSKKGFEISNNKGKINGWTHTIYGRVSCIINP